MTRFAPRIEPRRAIARFIVLVVLVELIGVITGMAVAMQARRSQTLPADAALVLLTNDAADQQRLDHARMLWSSGDVPRVVLAGADTSAATAYLSTQGVPADAIMPVRGPTPVVLLVEAQRLLGGADTQRVLLIAEPGQMLRLLKIARDAGLDAYSQPLGGSDQLPLGDVALEVGHYFRYVLMGQ